MRHLKDIALAVALCMIISIVPIVSFADVIDGTNSDIVTAADTTDPEATATAEPSATPDSAEPTSSPEASEAPDSSESPVPTATATASNSSSTPAPTSTAKPNGKYSINVNKTEKSTIVPSPSAAASGSKVIIKGNADRGYKYTDAYYVDSKENKTSLISNDSNSFSKTITMPASDITVYSTVEEMSASELYEDAVDQYDTVTADINSYTKTYINNSSDYNSSDISDMKKLITSAKAYLSDLKSNYNALKEEIDDKNPTKSTMSDVIYSQEDLDDVSAELKELSDSMGGEDVDYFDMTVTVGKGGKLTISGLVSGTVNGFSSKTTDTFDEIYNDGSSSITFKINTQNGYSLSSFKINGKTVTVSGNTVTIKQSALSNYISGGTRSVVANFGYSNGSGSGSGGTGGNTYNPVIKDPATPTPAPGNNSVFTDLGSVSWAEQSIMALYNMGIVNGMGDGLFEPSAPVTREQFAKMIVGVMGYQVDQNATTEFSDANGDWYTPYIAAAVEHGIITGRDDGTFGVGQNITREDIAVIIFRTQGSPAAEMHEFPDSDQISDYAEGAVSYMYSTGIARGDDNGYFNPKNSATRAEASKMLFGLYGIINSK